MTFTTRKTKGRESKFHPFRSKSSFSRKARGIKKRISKLERAFARILLRRGEEKSYTRYRRGEVAWEL